jgi:hypothetical protein
VGPEEELPTEAKDAALWLELEVVLGPDLTLMSPNHRAWRCRPLCWGWSGGRR